MTRCFVGRIGLQPRLRHLLDGQFDPPRPRRDDMPMEFAGKLDPLLRARGTRPTKSPILHVNGSNTRAALLLGQGLETEFHQLADLLRHRGFLLHRELSDLGEGRLVEAGGAAPDRRRAMAKALGGLAATSVLHQATARGKCGSRPVGENATSAPMMIDQASDPLLGVCRRAATATGARVIVRMARNITVASSKTASREGPSIVTWL